MGLAALFLVGLIETGNPETAVAVFGAPDGTVCLRQGQFLGGYRVAAIRDGGALLTRVDRAFFLKPGQGIEDGAVQITTGLERRGDQLVVSESLRDFVAKDGLLDILMQAAAVPVDGGYQLLEIDRGSVYDLAGLKDGDVVHEVDGIELTGPLVAIKALSQLKSADQFSFRFSRDGRDQTMRVVVR